MNLSPAETEVLNCLCEGLTNKQIATRLNKAMPTVKQQLRAIFKKLDVKTRTGAVVAWLNKPKDTLRDS